MRQHALDRQMRLAGIGGAKHRGDTGAASTKRAVGARRERNRHGRPGSDDAVNGATKEVSLYHKAALESPVFNMWNESGTNRGRIGDSATVRLRSLRDMAWSHALHTR